MALHMRKLFLVSFSCGGGPRLVTWELLDEGAKVDDDVREVEREVMLLDWMEGVVMARLGIGFGIG